MRTHGHVTMETIAEETGNQEPYQSKRNTLAYPSQPCAASREWRPMGLLKSLSSS